MNKPSFVSVPMETGLRWRAGNGFREEEKLDGRWHVEELPCATVIGELMPGGQFYAFDILNCEGQDLRPLPLSERLKILSMVPNILRPEHGGPELLARVLARGGEGVVRKRLDQPYGAQWEKCKRVSVFYCRVADLDPMRGSAILVDRDSGEKRGKLPLRNRYEQVRVGSILKVEAFGITARGLLREARLDKDSPDSWLISF
jgi:hypothetical protein